MDYHISGEQSGEKIQIRKISAALAVPPANWEKLAHDGEYWQRFVNVSGVVVAKRFGHIYLPELPNIVAVGTNNADTAEKDLQTRTLPAGHLAVDGWYVYISAAGDFSADAGAKTVRLYFGATMVASNDVSGAPVSLAWSLQAWVYRTGSATQLAVGTGQLGGTRQSTIITTPAETLANAVTIKVTGQNGLIAQPANTVRSRVLMYQAGTR